MSITLKPIKKRINSKITEDLIRTKAKEILNIQHKQHVVINTKNKVNTIVSKKPFILNNNNNNSRTSLHKYSKSNDNQSIKLKTIIPQNYLFHYAHFVCDFLFPLICNGYHKFKTIIREKSLNQTIGVFGKMFTEITETKYEELPTIEYNKYPASELIIVKKEDLKEADFKLFQNFMWEKYKVKDNIDKGKWPEVVLIKRTNQLLLNIDEFETNKNEIYRLNNGSERREITEFTKVQDELTNKFPGKIETISLENTSFEYQVNLFYHAKVIVAAHGAALTNIFFCKPKTTIVEIKSISWPFFNTISNTLKLNHIICENKFRSIKNVIDNLIDV